MSLKSVKTKDSWAKWARIQLTFVWLLLKSVKMSFFNRGSLVCVYLSVNERLRTCKVVLGPKLLLILADAIILGALNYCI